MNRFIVESHAKHSSNAAASEPTSPPTVTSSKTTMVRFLTAEEARALGIEDSVVISFLPTPFKPPNEPVSTRHKSK